MATKGLLILTFLYVPLSPSATEPPRFVARVVSVDSGDTVSIWYGRAPERIRLFGIETPQSAGELKVTAREFLAELVLDQTIVVEPHGRDHAGLRTAILSLRSGHVVNDEIVRAGLALWCRKSAATERWLEHAETEARSRARGIWARRDESARR